MAQKLERRWTTGEVEIRQESGGKVVIEGHGAVFNRISQDLGGFVERVLPGTFRKTIQEADVRALINHDKSMVLGRNKSGTLELSEDDSGLYYRIYPPDTSYARDLMVSMERGDINQSSFAFHTVHDEWAETSEGYPLRSLTEVKLVDVSPVTYPAYLDSESGLGIDRGLALSSLATRAGVEVTDLSDEESIRKALAGKIDPEPSETHSGEQFTGTWARRARFMKDLERMIRAENQ